MSTKVGVAIVGGTGYGAAELLRLCGLHPRIDVVSVVSSSAAGTAITDSHPHLLSLYDQAFVADIEWERLATYSESAILLALPHGTAAHYVRSIEQQLSDSNAVLFDLSGDYRLADSKIREQHYPGVSDEEQREVVYGLPELFAEQIRSAKRICLPGCLATVATLAALPLFQHGIALGQCIVADVKTGSSGAGRTPSSAFHHPSRHDDANAYKILEHRHEPEIIQNWTSASPHSPLNTSLMFVPHVIPCSRGCYASVYCETSERISQSEINDVYESRYADAAAIRIRKEIVHLNHVVGTNYCDVHVVVRGSQIACFAALDNLVKGASGQLLQCLNLRFGFEELCGLEVPALGPC